MPKNFSPSRTMERHPNYNQDTSPRVIDWNGSLAHKVISICYLLLKYQAKIIE